MKARQVGAFAGVVLLALGLCAAPKVEGGGAVSVPRLPGQEVLLAAEAKGAPAADFSADRVEVRPDMEIKFFDESQGEVTSWKWDFGDGSTSTEKNPIHVYAKNGQYSVTLTVTGPGGSDTATKTDFVRISEDCNC